MSANHLQRVRTLFREMLDVSGGLRDYNFRHYFIRRATQDLHRWDTAHEATELDAADAQEKLEQLKRIKIVQNMYYQ